jgi:DNA-binding response OmpR family regulator
MPRVSGYVAARLLKDDWQTTEIPVLLLTSLDAASDRYWGAQTGADRFLTKDFEAPELIEAVREAMVQADAKRGGRPAFKPDPSDLGDDEVLARVSELLDRKLFEASVSSEVTQIAADVQGLRGDHRRGARRARAHRRLGPGGRADAR